MKKKSNKVEVAEKVAFKFCVRCHTMKWIGTQKKICERCIEISKKTVN